MDVLGIGIPSNNHTLRISICPLYFGMFRVSKGFVVSPLGMCRVEQEVVGSPLGMLGVEFVRPNGLQP